MPAGTFVQDIVNSFDAGVGKSLVRGFLVAVVLSVLIGFYVRGQFRGLRDAEAMEYAQLGRNLAAERGFTTYCIRPSDVSHMLGAGEGMPTLRKFPDTRHAPAYPVLLAAGFKALKTPNETAPNGIFVPESRIVLPIGIALTVIAGLFVFALTRRLFDATVATTATIVYFATETVLANALSGTPLPLASFLTVTACYAGVAGVQARADGKPVWRWLPGHIAAAVLAGLAALTLYSLLAVAVALTVYIALGTGEKRWGQGVLFLLIVAMVVAPWLVRNHRVAGSALGTAPHVCLNDSALYEGDSFDRDPAPTLKNTHVAWALRRKLFANLTEMARLDFRDLGAGLVVAFFLVSCFHKFEAPDANVLRWAVVLALVGIIGTAAVAGGRHASVLGAFIPVLVVFATAFFYVVATRQELLDMNWYGAMIAAYVGLCALTTLLKLAGPNARLPYPPYAPRLAAGVCDFVNPDEVVCTDIPWATAWYGNSPSLLLPVSPSDLTDPVFTNTPVGGIYLTSETVNRSHPRGMFASWNSILRRQIPEDVNFPYTNAIAIPPAGPAQLFLSKGTPWERPSFLPPVRTEEGAEGSEDG